MLNEMYEYRDDLRKVNALQTNAINNYNKFYNVEKAGAMEEGAKKRISFAD